MLNRRAFVRGAISAGLALPVATEAQQSGNLPRVGYVQPDVPTAVLLRKVFLEGLRERGWSDGRNVAIDWRRRDEEIADLVRLKIDVLVLPSPYRIEAGLKQTTTIPIVTVDLESDPVAKGWLKSLARPGGNITGVWMDFPDIAGKQLQMLKEGVPAVRTVAVVWDERVASLQYAATQTAAQALDITVQSAALPHESAADDVVKRALPGKPQAILMLTSPIVFRAQRRIAELAVKHRLPTFSGFSTFPDEGGLMAYGPDFPAMWHQMAGYVDRILRGAHPAEMPVERPSKFKLVINRKIARALGLAIPPSLLLRADHVVE